MENGFHFERPQIDWAGDQAGFVGTEFPILPFTAAIAYNFFGVQEWVGRLQAILAFVLSLPFLFGIVRRAFDETVARYALVFYSFAPLSIAAGRAFLPDMSALALAFAVAADQELGRGRVLDLQPVGRALPRAIDRGLPLRDDAFEARLERCRIERVAVPSS